MLSIESINVKSNLNKRALKVPAKKDVNFSGKTIALSLGEQYDFMEGLAELKNKDAVKRLTATLKKLPPVEKIRKEAESGHEILSGVLKKLQNPENKTFHDAICDHFDLPTFSHKREYVMTELMDSLKPMFKDEECTKGLEVLTNGLLNKPVKDVPLEGEFLGAFKIIKDSRINNAKKAKAETPIKIGYIDFDKVLAIKNEEAQNRLAAAFSKLPQDEPGCSDKKALELLSGIFEKLKNPENLNLNDAYSDHLNIKKFHPESEERAYLKQDLKYELEPLFQNENYQSSLKALFKGIFEIPAPVINKDTSAYSLGQFSPANSININIQTPSSSIFKDVKTSSAKTSKPSSKSTKSAKSTSAKIELPIKNEYEVTTSAEKVILKSNDEERLQPLYDSGWRPVSKDGLPKKKRKALKPIRREMKELKTVFEDNELKAQKKAARAERKKSNKKVFEIQQSDIEKDRKISKIDIINSAQEDLEANNARLNELEKEKKGLQSDLRQVKTSLSESFKKRSDIIKKSSYWGAVSERKKLESGIKRFSRKQTAISNPASELPKPKKEDFQSEKEYSKAIKNWKEAEAKSKSQNKNKSASNKQNDNNVKKHLDQIKAEKRLAMKNAIEQNPEQKKLQDEIIALQQELKVNTLIHSIKNKVKNSEEVILDNAPQDARPILEKAEKYYNAQKKVAEFKRVKLGKKNEPCETSKELEDAKKYLEENPLNLRNNSEISQELSLKQRQLNKLTAKNKLPSSPQFAVQKGEQAISKATKEKLDQSNNLAEMRKRRKEIIALDKKQPTVGKLFSKIEQISRFVTGETKIDVQIAEKQKLAKSPKKSELAAQIESLKSEFSDNIVIAKIKKNVSIDLKIEAEKKHYAQKISKASEKEKLSLEHEVQIKRLQTMKESINDEVKQRLDISKIEEYFRAKHKEQKLASTQKAYSLRMVQNIPEAKKQKARQVYTVTSDELQKTREFLAENPLVLRSKEEIREDLMQKQNELNKINLKEKSFLSDEVLESQKRTFAKMTDSKNLVKRGRGKKSMTPIEILMFKLKKYLAMLEKQKKAVSKSNSLDSSISVLKDERYKIGRQIASKNSEISKLNHDNAQITKHKNDELRKIPFTAS